MPKETKRTPPFEGFTGPNYTQVPDVLFDQLMPDLSDPELRVLLYIIRRTYGFKRDDDNISLSQMVNGITTVDGRVLDRGTGLSKATVARTLKTLRQKGIIKATRNRSIAKGNEPTTYRLRGRGEEADFADENTGETPLVSQVRQAPLSQQRDTPLSQQRDTQYTGIQNTDNSKFRKAHAKKSRDETVTDRGNRILRFPSTEDPQTPSNHIESHHTVSEAISTSSDDTAAAAGPSESQGLSAPVIAQMPATDDSVTPGGHSTSRSRLAGGFESVAELLPTPPPGRPPGSREDRDLVTAYLQDFRPFLGDEAPLWSSVSRAINIFKAGRIPRERWAGILIEANSITKAKTQHIQKMPGESSNGFAAKNRTPYYFAVLEDLCGLRVESDSLPSSTP